MISILKYILLTAIRDRLYVGLFLTLLIAFGISFTLGSTTLTESSQTTIAYISGSSRMIFAIGIILFVSFYVRKSFDNREVEFILSKSISRHNFIVAYLLGFIIVSLLILLPLTIVLFFIGANKIGLIYWFLSIFFESLIIITFSLLAALVLSSAVSAVLASLGFYILSRMMGFFVLTVKIPDSISDVSTINLFLESTLKIISVAFPRLDLFTKSEWLIYGATNISEIYIIAAQSLIYIPLLTFMAFYDFNRKQF
jgi:hypothetical protein